MVPVIAVLVIGGVEAYALSKGIDGKGLIASVGALSAIAGYYYSKAKHGKT